ncbi:MAG: HNH endonuclease, partial [Candidatus Thorarchaeota archaeon]
QRFYRSWKWRAQAEQIKKRDNSTCQGCGWDESEVERIGVHHVKPLENWDGDWHDYPDEMLATLCEKCHSKTECQERDLKWPQNGRGEDARLDRLHNPESRQAGLDDFG